MFKTALKTAASACCLTALLASAAAAQTAPFYFGEGPAGRRDRIDARVYALCAQAKVHADPRTQQTGAGRSEYVASRDAYYGHGEPRDPALARTRALSELDAGDQGLGGAAVLMMIYANGEGVGRDLDVAIHYACRLESAAAAETEMRVLRLDAMKRVRAPLAPFDYCDDLTSGFASTECAALDRDRALNERARSDEQMSTGWSDGRKGLLARLRTAEDAYAAERMEHESREGGGGSWPAFYAFGLGADVHEESRDVMKLVTSGSWAAAGYDPAASDRALNVVDRRALSGPGIDERLTPDGLRDAERAWIAYRDAWIALAREVAPGSERAVAAELTQRRVRARQCLLGETCATCGGH